MKLTKRTTGIAAAVVLASGLAVATTTSAFADSHGSAKTAAAGHAKAGKDGQKAGRHGKRAGERKLLLHAQHGESTVTGKDGTAVVHEWQVGKVTAASGTSLTVVSADGTSWTWTESSQTRTRGQGKDTAVKAGDEILVQGLKNGSANDARVVLDPGAAKIAQWEARLGAKSGQGKHHKADGSQPTGQDSQDSQGKSGTSGAPA
jgi:hypothetical protein